MLQVTALLVVVIILSVVADHFNSKRKEAKGICHTTGGGCTSPTGCTCDSKIKNIES
ncbi:hypothetical protein [Petrocella sp. FN5]|uniref:hypothetical protein n=1 Tax=Petrocella sp. FN5 TaxID=3032002 RepID=UPI0023DB17A5|nr:hypothetical protein [Petrocella sp. FN5]MDF1618261.1 hypothetical protein [Petrocella sp. FN5]